jgi:hypothetical protein
MISTWVNRVLDRAEQWGGWLPCLAGVNSGIGLGWVLQGAGWAWLFLGIGLTLTAIQPGGTSLRRRLLIRQVRQQIATLTEVRSR